MEATCKTLVTQRMKRSGMAWTPTGGQAILTLRSLIQSDRWSSAWELLSADFRQTVVVRETQRPSAVAVVTDQAVSDPAIEYPTHVNYAALPLAA
jgi:hypothetical protein